MYLFTCSTPFLNTHGTDWEHRGTTCSAASRPQIRAAETGTLLLLLCIEHGYHAIERRRERMLGSAFPPLLLLDLRPSSYKIPNLNGTLNFQCSCPCLSLQYPAHRLVSKSID